MFTAAVGVPETQDAASSLDTSGGSDMAVVTQFTIAPHPEQLDGAGAHLAHSRYQGPLMCGMSLQLWNFR